MDQPSAPQPLSFTRLPDLKQRLRAVLFPPPVEPGAYDLSRVWTSQIAELQALVELTEDRWRVAVDLPQERRVMLFTNASLRAQLLLLSRLADEAYRHRFTDRATGRRIIATADELLALLAPDERHEELAASIEAKVHMHRANYHRMFGEIQASEQAFALAHDALKKAHRADPLDRALYNYLRALLDLQLGLFTDAERRLQNAIPRFQRFTHRELPNALITRALVHVEQRRFASALADLRLASHSTRLVLEPGDDLERTILFIAHNKAFVLERAGKYWAALKHLHQTERLYDNPAVSTAALKITRDRLYARIYLALGRLEEAQRLFTDIRKRYEDLGNSFEAVWCGLELATVHFSLGDPTSALELAAELYAYGAANGLTREALTAVEMIKEATALSLTPALLLAARSIFEQLQRKPHLRAQS